MTDICKAFLLLGITSLLFSGCAATPEASQMDDATAKQFESVPGAAIVYLYRADLDGPGSTVLWLNGRLIGELLPKTYFRVPVRAGKNLLTAYAGDTGRLEFETQRSEIYFVAIVVYGGLDVAPTSRFSLVPADTGRVELLRCCTLLETWRPGQNRMPL